MDRDSQIKKYSNNVERISWILVFLGMLSEISSTYAFPSYNVALGFWGVYSSFSKHGRAVFGLISFTFFAIILDIIFCSINRHKVAIFEFCLTMFILCLFMKLYVLYQASLYFTAIGGAYSLESSQLTTSMYESLRTSQASHSSEGESAGGYYYPPTSNNNNINNNNNIATNNNNNNNEDVEDHQIIGNREYYLNNSAMIDSGNF